MNLSKKFFSLALTLATSVFAQGLVIEEIVDGESVSKTTAQPTIQETPVATSQAEAAQQQAAPAQTATESVEQQPQAVTTEESKPIAQENISQEAQTAKADSVKAEQPAETASVIQQEAPKDSAKAEQNDWVEAVYTPQKDTATQVQPAVVQNPEQAKDSTQLTAQDSLSPTPAIITAEKTNQDTLAVEQKKTESKHKLDILHGNAYNTVNNVAAAPTIGGDMAIPHKMHGHKVAYLEPVNENGVAAFGESTTYFLGFDNSEDLGLITAGFAFHKFGLSLETALGKNWTYKDTPSSEENTFETKAGTMAGATVSFLAGSTDLALQFAYINPEEQKNVSGGPSETTYDIWDIKGKLLIANTSSSNFAWSLGINFLRHNSSLKTVEKTTQVINGATYLKTTEKTVIDSSSRIEVIPELNIAGTVLSTDKSRLLLGLNTMVPLAAFDRIEGVCSRNNVYSAYLSPNVLAEMSLNKYLLVFGSAEYQWNIFKMSDSLIKETTTQSYEINSGSTTVSLGTRLQYETLAVEMAFTKQFLQNPFGSFSNTDAIAISIGALFNF